MSGEAVAARPAGSPAGVTCALAAFAMWGLFPVYFKIVADVPAVEVLAHRIVWSALLAGVLVTVAGRWLIVQTVLADRRAVGMLALSAAVISVNWGVFIWAIANERVLESSLGYYINPLVSVALGVVFLGERLRGAQWTAVALAAAGVAWEVIALGDVPWVSLALAFSFGSYGLLRKVVRADSLTGLFVETALISPLALGYLILLGIEGAGAFRATGAAIDWILAASGIITAAPLLLFVEGARRIRLSTLGLLQYLVPTGHFLLAVFAFGEPFALGRLITFAFIWTALAIFTWDAASRFAIRHVSSAAWWTARSSARTSRRKWNPLPSSAGSRPSML